LDIGNVAPGGAADVAVTSSFFTSATQFWIFEEHETPHWVNSQAKNISVGDNIQQFKLKVTDGGPFDVDGKANGHILLIGGPRDSFWGYVIGTLFIRFFGVFIVLCALMIGMLISGFIFHKLVKQKLPDVQPEGAENEHQPSPAESISPEMAAAVGMVLHLHFSQARQVFCCDLQTLKSSAWEIDGRHRMMDNRLVPFNRSKQ